MNPEPKTRDKVMVSLFFAVFVVVLLMVLYLMGTLDRVYSPRKCLYVAFRESVSGLEEGSPVTYFGVKVGEVGTVMPMGRPEAKTIVAGAGVVLDPDHANPLGQPLGMNGVQITGVWNQDEKATIPNTQQPEAGRRKGGWPVVLVEIRVQKECFGDLNHDTSAQLELLNITGGNAIRIETKPSGFGKLREGDVVVATRSPFTRFKERLWDENTGILSEDNIAHLKGLIENMKNMSESLNRVVKNREGDIDAIVGSLRAITSRLEELTQRDGKEAHLTAVLVDMRVLLERMNRSTAEDGDLTLLLKEVREVAAAVKPLVEQPPPGGGDPGHANVVSLVGSMQDLVRSLQSLAEQVSVMAGSVDLMLAENRERLAQVLEDMDRMARRVRDLAGQIDQDPSSLVGGRRGEVIGSPAK